MRKQPLVTGSIYHVFNKSISGYRIFRTKKDYNRMLEMIKFYKYESPPVRFSAYINRKNKDSFFERYFTDREHLIEVIAYCLMPTHLHLVLKQLSDKGISVFMKNLLDSYTRYFNTKNNRKGPLWQGRFKSVLIEDDEQLLHLTRYIHLNPTSDDLVEKPEDWKYSSYNKYLCKSEEGICNYSEYIEMEAGEYKRFVESRQDYQKSLNILKNLKS
ncbi:MAG: hypothetical protein D6726_10860 [Nitrospirae bacterium]|nr:MAG: hypothetical protein D6726_10860 [Nitrospirota bacterium]